MYDIHSSILHVHHWSCVHTSPLHMHKDSCTSCIRSPGAVMSPGGVCGGHVAMCTLLQCLERLVYCHSYLISLSSFLSLFSPLIQRLRKDRPVCQVYTGSVIDISESVVGGHVIMCPKPDVHA